MAQITNDKDLILQGTTPRVVDLSTDYISLSVNTSTIVVRASGVATPSSFIATPFLNGELTDINSITWSVNPAVAYSVNSSTKAIEIQAAALTAGTPVTVTASLLYQTHTKTASHTITKISNIAAADLTATNIVLPANSSGTVLTYSGASTTMSVYVGNQDDSANWTYNVTKINVTTNEATTSRTQTVTSLTGDLGYITITASKTGFDSISKTFVVSKQAAGAQGIQGVQGIEGVQGDPGIKTFSGLVYYTGGTPTGNSSNAPSTSTSALSGIYNFSTNTFSSLSANWSLSAPIFQAGNGYKYWYSRFTVVESSSGSNSGTASFSPASQTIGFSGLVTFSSATPTTLTTSSGNTFNYTAIDGGSITTNSITANKLNIANLSAITADLGTVTAGSLTSANIRTKNPTGLADQSRIELNWDNSNLIKFYNSSNVNILNIGKISSIDNTSGLITIDNRSVTTAGGVPGLNVGLFYWGSKSANTVAVWSHSISGGYSQYGYLGRGLYDSIFAHNKLYTYNDVGFYESYIKTNITPGQTWAIGLSDANGSQQNQPNTGLAGFFWARSIPSVLTTQYYGTLYIGDENKLANGVMVAIRGGLEIERSSTLQFSGGSPVNTSAAGPTIRIIGPIGTAGVTHTYTLPDSLPTANNQVLSGSTTGTLSWAAAGTSYTLPLAATGTRGGVQIGYTTTGRNYAVQLDANERMYVNVPWTDTDTDTIYSLPLAATGTRGGVQIGFATDSNNRNYAVQLSNEKMYVNVPWTDTDTNTWNANALNVAGYVAAPTNTTTNKVWKTDGSGNPAWRDDSDTIYSLPKATATTLGGIIIGSRLSIDANGVLSAADQSISTSASVQFGSFGVGTAASGTTGEIRATNEITAYYSDRRLKENVSVISNALDKIKKLNGITYTPNDLAATFGYNKSTNLVGLFADEVKQVLPQAVKPAPFDIDSAGNSISGENYETIQYEKLIPLLVEAIKEQQKQIDQLKRLLEA